MELFPVYCLLRKESGFFCLLSLVMDSFDLKSLDSLPPNFSQENGLER